MDWNDIITWDYSHSSGPVQSRPTNQISPHELLIKFEPTQQVQQFREARQQQLPQQVVQPQIQKEKVIIHKKGFYPYAFWILTTMIATGFLLGFFGLV